MQSKYYKHSGKFTMSGVIVAFGLAAIASCALAIAYSYLILYIPFIYVSFLITLGFGGLIGIGTVLLLKATKVRNTWVSSAVALAVTSIAFYFSWIVWLWALGRRYDVGFDLSSFFHFLTHPKDAWDFIVEINSEGSWTFKNTTVSGVMLWIVWAIEAAAIFGTSMYAVVIAGSSEPFCEKCNQWCDENENVLTTAPSSDLAEFERKMEMKDFSHLETLGVPGEGALDSFRMSVHTCSKCSSLNTLSVTRVEVKIKKGEREEKESEILGHLLITAGDVRALEHVGQKMYPAAGH